MISPHLTCPHLVMWLGVHTPRSIIDSILQYTKRAERVHGAAYRPLKFVILCTSEI